jgi:NAD(P)H-dependent FMN reductase
VKILGIVSSPRRLGNSEIVVKEMMNRLPDDWDKQMIRLNDLQIDRCKGCYACLPKEKRCVLKDDLNFFLDHILAADKVIIAAPVYWLGQQTSLKLINDRMISIQNNGAEYFTGKQCVIVIPHSIKEWDGYAREATMHFARFLGLDVTSTLIINETLPGDVVNHKILDSIQRLAMSLVDHSIVDFTDPDKVYCPDCGSSLLQIFHQGKWCCPMCAANGEWSVHDGNFNLSWQPGEHRRYTQEGMLEHGRLLDQIKDEFIRRKDSVVTVQNQYRGIDLWVRPEPI